MVFDINGGIAINAEGVDAQELISYALPKKKLTRLDQQARQSIRALSRLCIALAALLPIRENRWSTPARYGC